MAEIQFEEKRSSAYSEEIDSVELRCATVPAYAGMTLVEKVYAGMTALRRATPG